VTVFVARRDHSDAASNDVAIVLFQPALLRVRWQRAQPPTDRILQKSLATGFA
jgi:hypothetical protein